MKFLILFFSLLSSLVFGEELPKDQDLAKGRVNKYYYQYIERDHSLSEVLKTQSLLYVGAWAMYPVTQWDTLKNKSSFTRYKNNLGKLVFDNDGPFWNWFVHPMSGSQLYLFYRSDGYSRMESFQMTFLTSLLFEFTVEVLTEPASVQDLYQTPVLGSIFGLGIENFSIYLLNKGNPVSMFFGHLINPSTLLPQFQGKFLITPVSSEEKFDINGLALRGVVWF